MFALVLMAAMTNGGDVSDLAIERTSVANHNIQLKHECNRGGRRGCRGGCGGCGNSGCGSCGSCGSGGCGSCGAANTGCASCGGCASGCCGAPAGPPASRRGYTPEGNWLSDSENAALVVVRLPADARLMIDGNSTVSTDSVRTFVTPPLEQGKTYALTLKAVVNRDGKKMVATKKIRIRAGENATEIALNDFNTDSTFE